MSYRKHRTHYMIKIEQKYSINNYSNELINQNYNESNAVLNNEYKPISLGDN